MEIISNKEFECYETHKENWKNGGKTITLDGEPLIPAKDALLITSNIATNGDIIKTLFPGETESIGRKRIYYSLYPTGVMEFDITWWNAPYTKEASTTHEQS